MIAPSPTSSTPSPTAPSMRPSPRGVVARRRRPSGPCGGRGWHGLGDGRRRPAVLRREALRHQRRPVRVPQRPVPRRWRPARHSRRDEVTLLRTAAASSLAIRHLAASHASVATVVGTGHQAWPHVAMLLRPPQPRRAARLRAHVIPRARAGPAARRRPRGHRHTDPAMPSPVPTSSSPSSRPPIRCSRRRSSPTTPDLRRRSDEVEPRRDRTRARRQVRRRRVRRRDRFAHRVRRPHPRRGRSLRLVRRHRAQRPRRRSRHRFPAGRRPRTVRDAGCRHPGRRRLRPRLRAAPRRWRRTTTCTSEAI